MTDLCNICHTGTEISTRRNKYILVTCPNKCIHHDECISFWAMYESYCPKCEEELIDLNFCMCDCDSIQSSI